MAALANSLPRRGNCAPVSSNSLLPIFPPNPFNFNANTNDPEDIDFCTISDVLCANRFVKSLVSRGNLDTAEIATLFSTGIESKRRSGGKGGNSASSRN